MIKIDMDLRGKECPVPQLLVSNMVKAVGQLRARITLQCDDPLVHIEVPAWCRREGLFLVGGTIDGVWHCEIELNE